MSKPAFEVIDLAKESKRPKTSSSEGAPVKGPQVSSRSFALVTALARSLPADP